MGSGVNIWAFLVGLAAFAGWPLSRFTVPRRVGWANVLSGLGIPALSFSTVSLDDDGFQQKLICPATSTVRLSARTRVAPRQSLSDSSINAFVEAGDPIRVPMTSGWFVVDQPLELDTHFHAPIPIHSPFASSDFRSM
jgi:hypothetical protein